MRAFLLTGLAALILAGCQKPTLTTEDYQTVAKDPRRDTEKARGLTADAVSQIDAGHLDDAEKTLRAAIVADLFYGPAHNNLGLVYFQEKRLYLAATEFQYAVKLMPGATQPHNNLGMVFESIGRLEEAERNYDEALALAPDNTEVTSNLARVRVRQGRKDDKTRRLLEDVVMKSDRPDWVQWARDRLASMGRPQPVASHTAPAVSQPTPTQGAAAERLPAPPEEPSVASETPR
jgi:Tfp pilus assembly protein PilF